MNLTVNKSAVFPLNLPSEDNSLNMTMQRIEPTSRMAVFWTRICKCFFKRVHSVEEITLLPPEINSAKKTLVLDLDETLVHSSLEPVPNFDLKVKVKVDSALLDIYVLLRPGVFEFLEKVAEMYEVVIFTASLKNYADPVIDFIDRGKVVSSRLFRSECEFRDGSYVKNLSSLGRDLKKVVIVDNSPLSYLLHPDNGIPISSWFDDKADNCLSEILTILQVLSNAEDIPFVLKSLRDSCLELSPKNLNVTLEKFSLGRSTLNSPKPIGEQKFEFKENA